MKPKSTNLYNQLAENKLFKKSINFDLNRIKKILFKLGHPERKLRNVINIIGSDGKFSVLSSLKFFIEANNQSTNTYISPSLKRINERFWISDRYLSNAQILKSIKIIEKHKIPLTIFEALTVIFIINASKKESEYNLIEAGALFAKDSTNVFDFPLLQVIVNINKQHINFLKKKTLNEVIYQKVGFLSNFTNIYVGKQKKTTLNKIKLFLNKNNSKKIYPNNWRLLRINKSYFYKDKFSKIKLNSKYIHSDGLRQNLCLAIKIALDLKIKKNVIQKTIPNIFFEGRVQYLDKGKFKKMIHNNEKIIIDGAHSEIAAYNLAKFLKSIKEPKYAIWGMIKNKEPDLIIKKFKGLFKKIITVPIDGEKNYISSKILMNIAKQNNFHAETARDTKQAINKITSKERKTIVIFGSFYLIGDVLRNN